MPQKVKLFFFDGRIPDITTVLTCDSLVCAAISEGSICQTEWRIEQGSWRPDVIWQQANTPRNYTIPERRNTKYHRLHRPKQHQAASRTSGEGLGEIEFDGE